MPPTGAWLPRKSSRGARNRATERCSADYFAIVPRARHAGLWTRGWALVMGSAAGKLSRCLLRPNSPHACWFYRRRARFLVAGVGSLSQTKSQNSKDPLLPPSEDVLRAWQGIGQKLIDMAQDFPEGKYGFKVQKDQRTFGETVLHIASMDFFSLTASGVNGKQVGPDLKGEAPLRRRSYKTKADAVKLLKDAVAAGSAVIKEQGDAGLNKAILSPFTADPVRTSDALVERD